MSLTGRKSLSSLTEHVHLFWNWHQSGQTYLNQFISHKKITVLLLRVIAHAEPFIEMATNNLIKNEFINL